MSKTLSASSLGLQDGPKYGTASWEVDSDLEDRFSQRTVSWQQAAFVINAAVIGVGVLTIPHCFAVLGWVCAVITLVSCILANVFIAHMMTEMQAVHPQIISLPDALYHAFDGSRLPKTIMRCVLYFEKWLMIVAFTLIMADSLGSAFYSLHWCEPCWAAIIFVFCLPFAHLKSLQETHSMNIVNLMTIVGVAALVLFMLHSEKTGAVETSWGIPPTTTIWGFFGAVSKILFACAGNWMYFELMSEMKQPREFMKAFGIASPIQCVIYMTIGCCGYGFAGSGVARQVAQHVMFGPTLRAIAILLTVHVLCGTVMNGVLLVRFAHTRVSPKEVDSDTAQARLTRLCIFVAIFGGGIVFGLSMPSFDAVVGLVGALFEAPISFILPVLLYAKLLPASAYKKKVLALGAIVALLALIVMVVGTGHALTSFKFKWPFDCHCQDMWDTCECSARRMDPAVCPVPAHNHF